MLIQPTPVCRMLRWIALTLLVCALALPGAHATTALDNRWDSLPQRLSDGVRPQPCTVQQFRAAAALRAAFAADAATMPWQWVFNQVCAVFRRANCEAEREQSRWDRDQFSLVSCEWRPLSCWPDLHRGQTPKRHSTGKPFFLSSLLVAELHLPNRSSQPGKPLFEQISMCLYALTRVSRLPEASL
jgi:hypothetical protein